MSDLFGAPEIHTQPLDGDKGQQERGAYFTDDRLALAVCKTLHENIELDALGNMLEPGCGGGAFLRAARATWPRMHIDGIDLLPACDGPGHVETGDLFSVRRTSDGEQFDLALGNPDFGISARVVRHCMENISRGGIVAFVLRLSFLEAGEKSGRAELFRDYPLRLFQPVAQRQSFKTNGETDKVGLGLFVWEDGHSGNFTGLPPLRWR